MVIQRVIRYFTVAIGLFFLVIGLPSWKPARSLAMWPLYVSHVSPSSATAYVMADGHAYWGRLNGVVDLYHTENVRRVLISHEQTNSRYNFTKGRNDELYERAIDYLVWKGVPRQAIETVPVDQQSWMSSLGEAQQVAKKYPELDQIVVVTSAPHTRRSLLCFRRSMPENCRVEVYAAYKPVDSWEINEPLWVEYIKLFIYAFAA